jgi:glycosyltransferase 2 family protein
MFGGVEMNVFSQSSARPKRLRDFGAFQTDISLLDTITTTAIQRQTKALLPEHVHNTEPTRNRFPALTMPSRKPLKQRNSIRDAFLLRARNVITYKWPELVIRLLVTVVLLVYLFKSLSWQTMLVALIHMHPGNIGVGLVVGSSGIVLSAYQWRVLLRAQHIHFDLADLIKLYIIGITVSHFLPTGFGGDAFKCFYVGRKSHNGIGATTATIMCRVTGFASMIILVIPVMIVLHQWFPFLLSLAFMLLCLLGCTTIMGILLFTLLLPTFSKNRWARHRFFTRLSNVGIALHKSALMPRPICGALLYGAVFWLVAILNCYVYANALGIHEQLAFYFLAVPLAAIIASLPLSLNGFGLREGAFVYILSFVHVPSATALLLVFVLDLQALFFALIGGYIYFTLGSGRRKTLLKGKH